MRAIMAAFFLLAMGIPTEAKTHHHKHYRVTHRHYEDPLRGHGNVCTSQGRCATVASSLADRFRGLFRELESMGYALGSPGCLSSGHIRHSLHHWGAACDLFDQIARNRTRLRQPPPSVQIEVAKRHDLMSGCVWDHPDCGHFQLPQEYGRRPAYALARR